ncbi:hypothetical protein [Emticicia sp. 21SJ11W-3]|uniref:hypothetical protein n=1 Tax=Emticicia sp. 21SJ11W-3 TaxID=2916755 RepID=UPI00209E2984|nr:hypothetical protein [Emticicia sp. 21SJ11W-3]UTA69723.1 hypothetical protein MB380_07910 [Emticicia sp. 21SJ11W-3]
MLKDEQIFDILDGTATEAILQLHACEMKRSENYRAYFMEMKALHLDMLNMPLEKPSASFTESVMAAVPVHQPVFVVVRRKSWAARLPQVILGVLALAIITTIALAMIYAPGNSVNNIVAIPRMQELRDFLTGDFIRIVALLNLIVLLAVFDKKVLKPYFNERKVTLG